MPIIPPDEVRPHPSSFSDPNGRLFWWQEDLYRGIAAEKKGFCEQLFREGLVDTLIDKRLLVPTELTDLALDGYPLVLRHHLVPFVSYPFEWCGDMLKDAALVVLDLECELAGHGLSLQDAHPWNVLFDGCRPTFVDFGSIVPADSNRLWPAYDEFRRFFLNSLRLMAHGHGRIARWLMHDYDQGVLDSEVAALARGYSSRFPARQAARSIMSFGKRHVPAVLRPALRRALGSLKSAGGKLSTPRPETRLSFLAGLRREVEAIRIPLAQTQWSDYYEDSFPAFAPCDEWTEKHRSVHRVLSELRPTSVLDIGCNRGWYSQLAAALGSRVVAFDVDETCVDRLYRDGTDRNLQILPLVMNFMSPTPGYGLRYEWFSPAMARLRCDMVLALALTHHLVFKARLRFDQIADGLFAFSTKWLLVEFVPREDRYVREWWSERYDWYTLERFVRVLEGRFSSVDVLTSSPEPRVLLLCEKVPQI